MDSYYDSHVGVAELSNVSLGRASLQKTVKASELLKSFLIEKGLYYEIIE
jgi:hypothetical protein